MHVSEIHLRNFKSFGSSKVKLSPGFNAIVGPNGSGKCLRGDSRILLTDGTRLSIKELVDGALSSSTDNQVLGDGILTLQNSSGAAVFSLNPLTGKIESSRVQAFVKRKSPESLAEIVTRSGRRIVTTTYHPLITIRDAEIAAVKAEDLRVGEFVALPRGLRLPESKINLPLELARRLTRLYLGDSCVELRRLIAEKKLNSEKTWRQVSVDSGVIETELRGLASGQSIPLHSAFRLTQWLGLSELEASKILSRVKAKNQHIVTAIPLTLDCALAKFLGYLISEGRLVKNEAFFFNDSPEIRDDFSASCKAAFGLSPTPCLNGKKTFLVLPSAAVAALLEHVFGMPPYSHSRDKRIPPQLLSAPLNSVMAFLSALYDGDGSVSQPGSSKVCVEYATASRALADDLATLLLRFQIHSRISAGGKFASNTVAKTRRTYYRVNIYGLEDAEKLSGAIHSSILKRPAILRVLEKHSGVKRGTAVDVIPNSNGFINSALRKAGYTSRRLKGEAPARIRAYFEDRCLPTRKGLVEVATLVNKQHAAQLSVLAESEVFWDEIAQIRAVPGEEWVYDLCVEGNHNFLAEGVFAHNSNIIDALVFAFGESSLKSMRVKKSTDLILSNNKVAEVSLHLTDGKANSTVGRMVNRDGKTKYSMDGKRTKKYGIENFLTHHALSLTNVIKQGEVQRIVEINSKERRHLIDVVANVAEYEDKKREALNELARVEEHLREASTVLGEREGYLRELENERSNALKYRELKSELDAIKATLASLEVASKTREFEALINADVDYQNKLEALDAKVREIEAAILAKNGEKDEINKQIFARGQGAEADLQREIDSLTNAVENARNAIAEKQAQLAVLAKKIHEQKLDKQRAGDEVKGADKQKIDLEKELAETNLVLGEKRAGYESIIGASDKFSQKFHESRAMVERAGDDMLQAKQRLSELQASVSSSEEIIRLKQKEIERLKDGNTADYSPKLAQLSSEEKTSKVELANAQKQLDALFEREKRLNEQVPVLEDLILAAREKVVEISGRVRMAADSPASSSVEAVLALKEKTSGIYGTVEELVSYPSKYAVPIQTALGPRASFVVVDSVKTASKAIDFLKSKKLGRVSFIPLDKIRSSSISAEDRKHASGKGSHGFVLDHLEYDAEHAAAIEFVCGSTIIMESLAEAEPIIGKIRLTTMDGELVEGSGLISGGSFKVKVNLAGERKQLEEWERKHDVAKEEKDKLFADLTVLREETSEARKRKADAELALRSVEIQLSHLSEQERSEAAKQSNVKGAVASLESEIVEARKQIEAGDTERRELIRRLSELNLQILEAKQFLDVEKEANYGNKVKELERAIGDLKVRVAEQDNSLKTAVTQYTLYSKQFDSASKALAELEVEDAACREAVDAADKTIKDSQVLLKVKLVEQKQLSGKFMDLINKREKLDGEIHKLANESGKMGFEKEKLDRQKGDSRVRRAVIEEQLRNAKVALEEHAGVAVIEGKTLEDKPELLARSKILSGSMGELGNVNLRAIELYDKRLAEYKDQQEKVQRLFNEKEAVIGIITEIEGKKIATFMNTFNVINENFKRVFSQIFQGDGHLFLENPEKPFDAGLTIEVKLSNKEVKYLELMSGGEKSLIALIFLFAIQSVNPSGIYILDEADAALDAENSRKLAQLVKVLSADTQFIVVSHNQNVYKNADTLVGVAMTREGSRLVEVKLTE
ncbi:hypothetical protein AUJ14_01175 [Candidatus Micrarchaeota archaeon CG1_02_55_22]|nr:MAG: hypothetical protein AUJ14_01175 [Candidatus Micrarchaeota archaeon CG1_02_55_22]